MNNNLNPTPIEWIAIIAAAIVMAACGWVILGVFGMIMGSSDICTLSVVHGIEAMMRCL